MTHSITDLFGVTVTADDIRYHEIVARRRELDMEQAALDEEMKALGRREERPLRSVAPPPEYVAAILEDRAEKERAQR